MPMRLIVAYPPLASITHTARSFPDRLVIAEVLDALIKEIIYPDIASVKRHMDENDWFGYTNSEQEKHWLLLEIEKFLKHYQPLPNLPNRDEFYQYGFVDLLYPNALVLYYE
jgi:hypothetical protein